MNSMSTDGNPASPTHINRFGRAVLLCALGLLIHGPAAADAIIRTQAMLASTIAEYYVEEQGITVELEIGLTDIEAFRNLMPDEIYEKAGNEPRPLVERLADFFGEDFVIKDEKGRPLMGRIAEMEPRDRIKRDEISGEPLPGTEEEK
jgi:hypothetical protein